MVAKGTRYISASQDAWLSIKTMPVAKSCAHLAASLSLPPCYSDVSRRLHHWVTDWLVVHHGGQLMASPFPPRPLATRPYGHPPQRTAQQMLQRGAVV